MSIEQEEDVLKIPLNLISNWKWDSRREKEKPEELEELCENIKQHGLINAITVIEEAGKYKVIAGRRRLAACKKLGMKTITAFVKTDLKKDVDMKLITVSENDIRKEQKGTDSAYAWLDIYESEGYTPKQAIQGVKWIHNNKIESENILNGHTISSPQVANNERLNTRQELGDSFKPDKKFILTSRKISKAPNTQYQYLQWVVQLEKEVLDYADEKKLSKDKKILLTTKSLREHPKLQKELVDEIKDYSDDTAQTRIQQVASDLDKGYIEKVGKNTYAENIGIEREKVVRKGKVLQPPNVRVLNIHASLNKTLYQLTDHALTRNEHEYTENVVTYSKAYRLELVKGLNDKYLVGLEETLGLVKTATDELLQMIEQEHQDRENKKEMLTK